MRGILLPVLTLGLVACTEEPTPKAAEAAAKANVAEDTSEAVAVQKKSIEEAAEAAVKLIEEEARQEIEENGRAQDIASEETGDTKATQ